MQSMTAYLGPGVESILTELIVSATALFVALGGVVRFIFWRIDRVATRERLAQKSERDIMQAHLQGRIDGLDRLVSEAAKENRFLRAELHRYARHVGILEGLMRANHLEPPAMGPPAVLPEHKVA